MSVKILIISMWFHPSNKIGAVRPTNFAKWLTEYGHHVDVITMNPESPKLTHGNLKVSHVSNGKYADRLLSRIYTKISEKNKLSGFPKIKEQEEKKRPFLRSIRTQLLLWIECLDWRNQCLKYFPKMPWDDQYDIVFSTYGPVGSYWLGRSFHKRKIAKYWVSDLRDLMVSDLLPSWLNKFYSLYQQQMMNDADAITVVSDGAAKILGEQYCKNNGQKKKVHKINNGYEVYKTPTDNKCLVPKDDILRICYTGALYAGQRDMALLFEAMSQLIKEKRIEADKVQVHYAGGESGELLLQACQYDVDGCIVDHGMVSRDIALGLQNRSDIMVVLSWNTRKEQGILPGKFYEYLAVEKPIISITSGDLPNGELSNLVSDMNVGIACEYISSQKDLALLTEFIVKCYQCKEKGENIPFHPHKEMVAEYRYDNLSRKLESLFYSLMNE